MNELIKLIEENPSLPVVPMIDSEVVGDSDALWLGRWGECEVTEYYLGRNHVHFKGDDVEDVLLDMDGCKYGRDQSGRDIRDLTEEEWSELYQALPWVRCIVVYITA